MNLDFSPAAERNKAPILAELRRLLPPSLRVLEVASVTGQHAQHIAAAMPGWVWHPTEADPTKPAVIDARCDSSIQLPSGSATKP